MVSVECFTLLQGQPFVVVLFLDGSERTPVKGHCTTEIPADEIDVRASFNAPGTEKSPRRRGHLVFRYTVWNFFAGAECVSGKQGAEQY